MEKPLVETRNLFYELLQFKNNDDRSMYIVYVRPDVGSVTPEVRENIYI